MQFIKISFIILIAVYIILLLYFSYKSGRTLKTLLLFAASGLLSFVAVNLTSGFTGVSIAVNLYTTLTSAFFGVPGVFGLLVLRIFF